MDLLVFGGWASRVQVVFICFFPGNARGGGGGLGNMYLDAPYCFYVIIGDGRYDFRVNGSTGWPRVLSKQHHVEQGKYCHKKY